MTSNFNAIFGPHIRIVNHQTFQCYIDLIYLKGLGFRIRVRVRLCLKVNFGYPKIIHRVKSYVEIELRFYGYRIMMQFNESVCRPILDKLN